MTHNNDEILSDKIRQSFLAANTKTTDNEEEDHIIVALHEYEDKTGGRRYTYMIDISKNDMLIESIDFEFDEKKAYKVFHEKQIKYFKRILVI